MIQIPFGWTGVIFLIDFYVCGSAYLVEWLILFQWWRNVLQEGIRLVSACTENVSYLFDLGSLAEIRPEYFAVI